MYPLSHKKLFLFDIDGTLSIGDTLFEGSDALLSYINTIGGKSYFITNNSTKSAHDYVRKFRDCFHLHTTENQFVSSGFMTIRFMQEHYPQEKIYCLGTRSFVNELRKQRLCITETPDKDIACILVAYDDELTYEKLVNTCRVLTEYQVPYYATNPDLCCPAEFGFIPDCGSICQMLESSCGRTPIYLGKPNPEVVEVCLADSGFSRQETLVVGDRLYTDIACGINAGVDTCVLFTGEAVPEDLDSTSYPLTYAFTNVRELLNHLKPGAQTNPSIASYTPY
jgi:HAD superfamily hydrolase (TIGR01450 family)